MKNAVVYFGSTTGTCEDLANRIAEKLGIADVKNVQNFGADAEGYDVLILGTSTWGAGELQDDWAVAVDSLKSMNLKGKTVAIFGCGDSQGFSDTFCGGMKALYDAAVAAGADVIGQVDAAGYTFDASDAVVDGKFVGLALDEVNESDKTDGRIDAWVPAIKAALA